MAADEMQTSLQQAVKALHGVESEWIREVDVVDEHGGEVAWRGRVSVLRVVGHPDTDTCYAWSYVVDEQTQRRKFMAVLGIPPINSALDAVRAAIASGQQD